MNQNKTRPEWASDRERDDMKQKRHAQSEHQTERGDMKQNKTHPEWASDRER